MGLLTWLLLGAFIGAVGSFNYNRCHEGFWGEVTIGTLACIVGAMAANFLGWRGIEVFNWGNVGVGVVMSVVAITVYNAYRRRHPYDPTYA